MRSCGAEPIDRCRSEAPLSTMALSSCCKVTVCGGAAVAMGVVLISICRRDAGDLVDGAGAGAYLGDPAHAQGAHALPDGLGLDLGRRRPLQHQLFEGVAE